MAKRLYLMRHAKSSWKKELPDHERPLNRRGKRAAKLIGKTLKERKIFPDSLLVSDAKRARATAKKVLKVLGEERRIPSTFLPALYEADAEGILEIVRSGGGASRRVLLIGHNPAISDAAVLLSGDPRFKWLPTGAVVGLEFPIEEWRDLEEGSGRVILALTPRELE